MGYYQDLGTSTVLQIDERTRLPIDEYGHLLDKNDIRTGEPVEDWNKPGTELYNLTNPYGFLHFAIGNDDNFTCFDYAIVGHWLILHAVINSETGGFIMDGNYRVIDLDDPCGYDYDAHGLVEQALDWLFDPFTCDSIRHHKKGWNQDPFYFARCVHLAVCKYRGDDVPNFSEREKRFGGKRINRFCGVRT